MHFSCIMLLKILRNKLDIPQQHFVSSYWLKLPYTGADPAQNLTGFKGAPKNFECREAARKIF